MPLGGLLPYGPTDDPLSSILSGPNMNEAARPTVAPAVGGGGGILQQLAQLAPQMLTAFASGQAIRQRDPRALAAIVQQFVEAQEQKRRMQLAEEAQRLREEREQRLAEMAAERESRLIGAQEQRIEQDRLTGERQGRNDLNTLINTISDDARTLFESNMPEGAALEEYISQQAGRVGSMQGGDPNDLRALLMSMATMAAQPEPEVPYIERTPGTPAPATVPKGAIVRNAPQPRQGPQAPLPIRVTDEQGNIYLADPRTGKRITEQPIGQRPKTGSSLMDDLKAMGIDVSGAGGQGTAPTGPKVGERRRFGDKIGVWDGKQWVEERQ